MNDIQVVFFLVFIFTYASLSNVHGQNVSESSTTDSFINGLKMIYKTYQNCEQQEDMTSCLKLRALKFADRALKTGDVSLMDGMTLAKSKGDPGVTRDGRKMTEPLPEVDESSLSTDPDQRRDQLDTLLLDRVARFFSSHSLQFSVPKFLTDILEDTEVEEGRRKGFKKYGAALLMGLMMKGGLMAMAYKGVALLAGKALMVAKIALVLSAVVALKKLVGGGGGGDEKVTYEIVKHPMVSHAHSYSSGHDFDSSGGGGHYKRSLDEEQADALRYAQMMAYQQQIPEQQMVQPQVVYTQ